MWLRRVSRDSRVCIYIYIYGMPNTAMVGTRLIVIQRLFPN